MQATLRDLLNSAALHRLGLQLACASQAETEPGMQLTLGPFQSSAPSSPTPIPQPGRPCSSGP